MPGFFPSLSFIFLFCTNKNRKYKILIKFFNLMLYFFNRKLLPYKRLFPDSRYPLLKYISILFVKDAVRNFISPFQGPFERLYTVVRVILFLEFVNPVPIPLESIYFVKSNTGLKNIKKGKPLVCYRSLHKLFEILRISCKTPGYKTAVLRNCHCKRVH